MENKKFKPVMTVRGVHFGKPLQDVPAKYLLWVWDHAETLHRYESVLKYISENLRGIKKEREEQIKEHFSQRERYRDFDEDGNPIGQDLKEDLEL